MYQYFFNKLHVAYNGAFRQLLQEPRWCSASKLFVLNSVSTLPENMRNHYGVHCKLVTICLSMLFWHRTCFSNHQFLKIGIVVCF